MAASVDAWSACLAIAVEAAISVSAADAAFADVILDRRTACQSR